ncbi:MAG TPA: hypothetical protein IAB01_04440 [Candidatus Avidesulfovibrio excrementigallinarum]|nr:hypothetical protein [Candidatus Avidesulfovibrio excrementigallinarum]
MTRRYDDIIDLPRPASKYPRMPRAARAAQFAPFAALSGHADAIRETARQAEARMDQPPLEDDCEHGAPEDEEPLP